MTQWEKWDRAMQEDEDRRLGIARYLEAKEKRELLARQSVAKKAAISSCPLPPLRCGEGEIIRTGQTWCTWIYYDQDDIDHIAQRVPWLLRELMQELEENQHAARYPAAL